MMLLYQVAIPLVGFLALGLPFVWLERKFPLYSIDYRKRVTADLFNCALVFFNSMFVGIVVFDGVVNRFELWRRFDVTTVLPLWASLLVVPVAIDFTLYWLHRALHTRLLWPIHRWHHAPTEIYWLSGIRASFVQNTLYMLASIVWAIALHVPQQLYGLGGLWAALVNNFMHTNLALRWRWLERWVITPRAHHLHHRKSDHLAANYGAFFSIWDHWFGTFADPESAPPVKEFGISETVHPLRLIAGL
jgi:sterol desaturase/sphingolipid hydroxylase (fatty acid hydroxylase superfamily)